MSSDREEIRSVQTLAAAGKTIREITNLVDMHRNNVRMWTNRPDIKHNHHTVADTKLSPNTKRKITRHFKDKMGGSYRKCAKMLNKSDDYRKRDKTISFQTVRRYVKSQKWGLIARKMTLKPLKTQLNKTDRIKFARKVTEEGYCGQGRIATLLRENVLWTDETWVELNPKPNPQNTRIRTLDKKKTIISLPKHSIKILVAGGMTAKGVTDLYVCEKGETINGQQYEDKILPIYLGALNSDKLFSSKRHATFQQDNAPGHIIKSVTAKIKAAYPMAWIKGVWPGNSPDLNVIEHLWNDLQESVFEEPIPRDRQQLIDRVVQKWNSFTEERLSKLVHSFPNRIREVIDSDGGHTSY